MQIKKHSFNMILKIKYILVLTKATIRLTNKGIKKILNCKIIKMFRLDVLSRMERVNYLLYSSLTFPFDSLELFISISFYMSN